MLDMINCLWDRGCDSQKYSLITNTSYDLNTCKRHTFHSQSYQIDFYQYCSDLKMDEFENTNFK